MEQLVIGLFSPIILVAFILMAFALMVGINPESVLKPFFSLVAAILRSLISLFILGLKLALQVSTHTQKYIYSEPFKFSAAGTTNKRRGNSNPHIRIVPSDE